jgi:hypothetical protein
MSILEVLSISTMRASSSWLVAVTPRLPIVDSFRSSAVSSPRACGLNGPSQGTFVVPDHAPSLLPRGRAGVPLRAGYVPHSDRLAESPGLVKRQHVHRCSPGLGELFH